MGKPKIEECYDDKGNASHYATNRLNAIHKYERTYGTLAVMVFCEITAERYRERIGKKKGQSLEQEVLKISWYENAAKFYFSKLDTEDEIIVCNRVKENLPWENEETPATFRQRIVGLEKETYCRGEYLVIENKEYKVVQDFIGEPEHNLNKLQLAIR